MWTSANWSCGLLPALIDQLPENGRLKQGRPVPSALNQRLYGRPLFAAFGSSYRFALRQAHFDFVGDDRGYEGCESGLPDTPLFAAFGSSYRFCVVSGIPRPCRYSVRGPKTLYIQQRQRR